MESGITLSDTPMTTDARPDEPQNVPDEADLDGHTDYLDPATQQEIRERVIRLAFRNDPGYFDEFVCVLDGATPAGVDVILRGSSVIGHKWHHPEEPFDHDGPGTSDLDVTFVGGNMIMLFHEYHIPLVHSVPLSDEHPFASSALGPLRQRLVEMCGRPVNLQATTSMVQFVRDLVMDQPYLVLLQKPEEEGGDDGDAERDADAEGES